MDGEVPREGIKKVESVGVQAEWDPIKVVLMHEPGLEAKLLSYHYPSALYERPVSVVRAARQHRNYVRELEETYGATVYLVRDILERGVPSNKLRSLAAKQLQYFGEGMLGVTEIRKRRRDGIEADRNHDYGRVKREVLQALEREELVDIILTNPQITWTGNQTKGVYEPSTIHPRALGNLLFTRDQMITTAKGVVMSRMRTPQRTVELEVMKLVLEVLGIEPLYQVQKQDDGGYLEGGDFFPMDKFCLLGVGSRTDYKGAMQLLEHDVFGVDTVVLVNDNDSEQKRMHLDTYFNVLDHDAAVILGHFSSTKSKANKLPHPTVEVWYKQGEGYKCDSKGKIPFCSFLENEGFLIVGLSESRQQKYEINFLNTGGNRISGVRERDMNPKTMARHGTLIRWVIDTYIRAGRTQQFPIINEVPYREVNNMYGGHHCTTQVLYREAPAKR